MADGPDNSTRKRSDENEPVATELRPEFEPLPVASSPTENNKENEENSSKRSNDSTLGGSDKSTGITHTDVFPGGRQDVQLLKNALAANIGPAEKRLATDFDHVNRFQLVDNSADKNAADTPAKTADENRSAVEKAAAWLGSWFFAEKHGANPGDRSTVYSTNEKSARTSTTKFGEIAVDGTSAEGIHNQTRDSAGHLIADTKVTAAKIIDTNAQGDTATFDRITKTLQEKGIKGATVSYEPGDTPGSGKYTIKEGPRPDGTEGRTAEINAAGDVVYTDRKGRQRTIDNDWIQHGDRNGFNIKQRRRQEENKPNEHGCGDQERECTEHRGSKEVSSVTDTTSGKQMIVVNDGQGTVMKLHQDGRKEIIHTPETGNEVHLSTEPGSDAINARIGDKNHVIERNQETGTWGIKDSNGNPSGRIENGKLILDGVNGQPGQVIGSIDGDNLKIGSSSIAGDGTFSSHSDRGRVRLDRDRRQAVLEDNEGTASSVIKIDDTKSAVTDLDVDPLAARQAERTDVDTSNQKISISSIGTDGAPDSTILTFDGAAEDKGGNFLKFNTNDGLVDLNRTDKGIEANLWNGDKITAEGELHRKNGVIIDKDGAAHLADGKTVSPNGVFYESAEEYEESAECEDNSEAAIIARIESFSAIAAAIANNPNPTAGDLAYLSSLSSAIGAALAGDKDGCFAGAAAAAQTKLSNAMATIVNTLNGAASLT